MMKIANLGIDAIKLRFVPFALISLEAGSISSWDNFVKAFLKKFYHVHKTAQIRNSILQFRQLPKEPFCKLFERLKDLLA